MNYLQPAFCQPIKHHPLTSIKPLINHWWLMNHPSFTITNHHQPSSNHQLIHQKPSWTIKLAHEPPINQQPNHSFTIHHQPSNDHQLNHPKPSFTIDHQTCTINHPSLTIHPSFTSRPSFSPFLHCWTTPFAAQACSPTTWPPSVLRRASARNWKFRRSLPEDKVVE